MIKAVLPEKKFFYNKKEKPIFLLCFPMLYVYENLLLKDIKLYWPDLQTTISRQELKDKTCVKFTSKYGVLSLISLKRAEPGNKKKENKRLSVIKKLVNNLTYDKRKIVRVQFSSFVVGETDKYRDKVLNLFAVSPNTFEIYR